MKKLLALVLMSMCSIVFAASPAEIQEDCYKTSRMIKQVFMVRQLNPEQTEVQSNASFYANVKNNYDLGSDKMADSLIELYKTLNVIAYQFDVNEDPERVGASLFAVCTK